MQTIPYLQFRNDTILSYTSTEWEAQEKRPWQDKLTLNLGKYIDGSWQSEAQTYSGELRPGAKKRLTRCVELMLMATKKTWIYNKYKKKHFPFQVGFLTLTIYSPERNITGKESHKAVLEPFLLWLRRKHGVKMYLWKAELQERGQVHYHLLLDTWIDKLDIQDEWNRLQVNAGYLDMAAYQKKFGHDYVPSTKIHALYKKKNVTGYIKKVVAVEMKNRKAAVMAELGYSGGVTPEMAKTIQNRLSVHGKVWDCSINLKSNSYFTTVADNAYVDHLHDLIDQKLCHVTYTDTCTIFTLYKQASENILAGNDKKEYDDKMWNIRNMDMTLIRRQQADKRELVTENNTQPQKIIQFVPLPDLFSSS